MFNILTREASFKSSFQAVDTEVANLFGEIKIQGIRLDEKLRFIMDFALRELFNNAVEHGNKCDESKRVNYCLFLSERLLEIVVVDSGAGCNPGEVMKKQQQDCLMRDRNRGFTALGDIGFVLEWKKRGVCARLLLDKYKIHDERMGSNMNIRIDNKTVYCVLNTNLVAANIKEMVGTVRNELEGAEEYDRVIIDLTDCDSIDSMGITFLIGVYKVIIAKGKTVKLTGVSDAMLSLFRIMKLDEIFGIE